MRAPEHAIPAPPFPGKLPWVNVAPLRMDKQRGRPVLVEFWDFCRVNSLRTLPYLRAWHERYAEEGLRVIGIHTGGFLPARDTENVKAAVARLGIEYPVVIDERLELWDFYGNEGWPARYLWDTDLALYSLHYGEGAYQETERRDCRPCPVRAKRAPMAALNMVKFQRPTRGFTDAGGAPRSRDGLSQRLHRIQPTRFKMTQYRRGFLPERRKLPMRPNAMVNAVAPSVAASAGHGSQTKERFITSVITMNAASDPAATPTIAVASPISRYSST